MEQDEHTEQPEQALKRISDKRIRQMAQKYIAKHDPPHHAFLRGAKWMREELADMIQIIMLTNKNPNHPL